MENNFLSEAYKPAEKLVFNYFVIRDLFGRVLREQKFPVSIEAMILKVYKVFKESSAQLLSFYKNMKNVLELDNLLQDIEEETDAVFAESGFDTPLLDDSDAVTSLIKFLANIQATYLNGLQEHAEAIPGFNWDVSSFKEAFDQIEKEGLAYVNSDEYVRSSEQQ